MATEIEHQGTVIACNSGSLTVEILSKSACAGCHARGMCSASEAKTKYVEVAVADASCYAVGDAVSVIGTEGMGLGAVALGYVVPLVLMVVVLVVGQALGVSDGKAGLLALASLVPYYVVLYVAKGRLKRKFEFRIRKK